MNQIEVWKSDRRLLLLGKLAVLSSLRLGIVLSFVVAAITAAVPSPATALGEPCTGDCNQDSSVTIDEVVTGVDIVLERLALSRCAPLDANADALVTIDELISAVRNALDGCSYTPTATRPPSPPATCTAASGGTPTSTPTQSRTPSGTITVTPICTATQTPSQTSAPTRPWLEIVHTPQYGAVDYASGLAHGLADPTRYAIATALYVQGWWSKPYEIRRTVAIAADASWAVNATTGGCDAYAKVITFFLVPASYTPPDLKGDAEIPPDLIANAIASLTIRRGPPQRRIFFAGRWWDVKQFDCPAGPGPNLFSDSMNDVWVDDSGRLHMRIAYRSGNWYSTEVISEESVGYGEYRWLKSSRVDTIDSCAVIGTFLWNSFTPPSYGEIDIEDSRWCNPGDATTSQVVIIPQPAVLPGHLHRFTVDQSAAPDITNILLWEPGRVSFATYRGLKNPGDPLPRADLIDLWVYQGSDVPVPGRENARINIWMNNGIPPADGQPIELVVTNYSFQPLARLTPTSGPTAAPTPNTPWVAISPVPGFGTDEGGSVCYGSTGGM